MASRLLASSLSHLRSQNQGRFHSLWPLLCHLRSHPATHHPSPCSPLLALTRHLSTSARRLPSSQRRIDIGARARQLQNRRLWTYAFTFSSIAGFIFIVLSTFQDELVFYITPSDALAKFASGSAKKRFRLGGLVLEGSVAHPSSSSELEFVVTDLISDILVRHEGSLPDLFREGHSVVVEGFLKPFTDEEAAAPPEGSKVSEKARGALCFFKATEVLAKHDEKYMPKEVGAAIERNKKKLAEEAAALAATEGLTGVKEA